MAASDQFVEQTTSAAVEEKAKLQKHFSRFDIYFFLICTIVGVDTLGQVAANGAQGFLWLLFLAVFFFVPYALLTAELGAAFTEEGGAYIWTRMAFGRLTAAINAVFYWFSNPIWIGATLAFCVVPRSRATSITSPTARSCTTLVGLAFIWFSVYSAILSFGIGKWIPTLGAWCRILADQPVLRHDDHVRDQARPALPVGGKLQPDVDGVHRPGAAAVLQLRRLRAPQRRRRRDGGRAEGRARTPCCGHASRRSCSTACRSWRSSRSFRRARLQGKGVSAFLDAVAPCSTASTAAQPTRSSKIAAAGFILALVSSACTWLMGSDRSQAVASYDGAGPRILGRFSARYGTPINVNFLSGVFSTIVFLIASTSARAAPPTRST